MRKLLSLISAGLIWAALVMPASAQMGFGVTALLGDIETSGTETEKTVTGVTSETTSTTVEETFMGAAVYAEKRMGNGFAFGVEYVPVDIEIGSGARTNSSSGADVASEADTGDVSVSADVTDLFTFYARVPFPIIPSAYLKLGYHDATIKTNESLTTTSYGDVALNGFEYGAGFQNEEGTRRLELTYSDFDDISITGTGSGETNQNTVTADADAWALRLSLGF